MCSKKHAFSVLEVGAPVSAFAVAILVASVELSPIHLVLLYIYLVLLFNLLFRLLLLFASLLNYTYTHSLGCRVSMAHMVTRLFSMSR